MLIKLYDLFPTFVLFFAISLTIELVLQLVYYASGKEKKNMISPWMRLAVTLLWSILFYLTH